MIVDAQPVRIDLFDARFAPLVAHAPVLERLATGAIWTPYGLLIPEEGHGGESEIGDGCVFRFDPHDAASTSLYCVRLATRGIEGR